MGRGVTAQEVLSGVFASTQFAEGYDEREVDAFLDEVVAVLRHHEGGLPPQDAPMTSERVEAVRFTPTRLRRGYAMAEVDALLEDVVATLRQHETGGGVVAGGAAHTDPPRARPTPPPGIRPQESFGARVLRVLRGDKG